MFVQTLVTLFFPDKDRDGTTQFDTESTLVQGPGVNQRIERQTQAEFGIEA